MHRPTRLRLWAALLAATFTLVFACRRSEPRRSTATASASAVSATGSSHATRKAGAGGDERPLLLWRVTSAAATVHLLGSVHVAKPDVYPLDRRIEKAFRDADTLVLEVPMDPTSQASAAAKFRAAAILPAGQSVRTMLTKETRALIDRRWDTGLGPLEGFQPWFVATNLVMGELQDLGYSPKHGIDAHFQGRAGDKRQLSLETIDDQVAVFTNLSKAEQDLMLRETLKKLDGLAGQMNGVFDAWQNGDTKGIEQVIFDTVQDDGNGRLYDAIFKKRNVKMASSVEKYLRTPARYFVVVGSGHLVGNDGVVSLLRKRGHDVERI